MNFKKISIITLCVLMLVSFIMPISVNAEESGTYDITNLDSVRIDNVWTTKYYAPTDYYNVWICKNNIAAGYYLIYYNENTSITCGSGTTYSEEVLYAKFNTLEEAKNALFEEKTNLDLATMTSGPPWSKTYVYYIFSSLTQETVPGYYVDTAVSIEQAYYDWYVEKYGEEPTIQEDDGDGERDYSGFWGWFQKIWDILSEGFIATINKIGDMITSMENYFSTLFEKLDLTFTEILKLMNPITSGKEIFNQAGDLLNKQLADNKFYTSIMTIKNSLIDLYNEDYSSRTGFYELGLTNLTLRQTETKTYIDFGNETIGPWEQEQNTIKGKIDWGIQNAKILNLDWYFGSVVGYTSDGDEVYTKGLKPTIDAIISAFLWVMFAWWLYVNMPNWLSGDLTRIESLAVETHNNITGSTYTTRTVDNITGEVSEKTTTKKRK